MVVASKNVQKSPLKKVPKNSNPPRPPARNDNNEQKTNADTTGLSSKIHAQRKFAQGASVNVGFSPVKNSKVSHKKRKDKKPPSPTFLPSKRPKTEDFLTFLCFRGTPVLPKELHFFNDPPSPESSTANNGKEHNERTKAEETKAVEKPMPPPAEPAFRPACSSSSSSNNSSTVNHRKESTVNLKKDSTVNHKKDSTVNHKKEKSEKTPSKSANNVSAASEANNSSKSSPALKRIPDVMVVVKQAEKAIAAFGKVRKDLTTALLRPNRINENDARFAMTALKLKYQEKRMAKSKPALSVAVASKLTKKGRNVILTRSKAKYQGDDKPRKIPLAKKKNTVAQRILKESPSQSRNVPSPDIIYGVSHAKSASKKVPTPSRSSSSSESSHSSSNESSNGNSSSSDDEEEEEESDKNTPVVRSLRNGKEFVAQTKKPAETKPVKKQASARVSTRSSHRKSTSPLRELPMYGAQKKKVKKPNKSKAKAKQEKKQQNNEADEGSHHRPMRKTKETASIYLGLINNLSSDEDSASDKNPNDEDSSGNTSSSETKFLEKQYNASMKRVEQSKQADGKKQAQTKKPPSKANKPNKDSNNSKKEAAIKSLKSNKAKTKAATAASSTNNNKTTTATTTVNKKLPGKRVLRSQSNRDKSNTNLASRRVSTRRLSMPISSSEKSHPEGAARKSASVYPRRRGSYYYSSDSSHSESSPTDSSDEVSSASSTDSRTSTPKKSSSLPKSSVSTRSSSTPSRGTPVPKETKPKEKGTMSRRSSMDKPATPVSTSSVRSTPPPVSDVEPEKLEEPPEEAPVKEKRSMIEIEHDHEPNTTSSSSSETSDEEDDDDEDDDENGGDSSACSESEPKPPVSKTSIAIQVDMDSEENVDMLEVYSANTQTDCGTSMSRSPPVTSSTFTDIPNFMPSINIPHPFGPFTSPGGFYPTLHFTPPVVSNIQLLARGTQEFSFSHPGIAMNIPGSMQSYGGLGGSILQPNTMCFSATSISAAATLQTHIRSVAANLDIPLVRPIVGSENPLSIPFPRPPIPQVNHMTPRAHSMQRPLTMWRSSVGDSRPHSSAFRVPVSCVGGPGVPKPNNINNNQHNINYNQNHSAIIPNSLLPLSIVQPHQSGQQQQLLQSSSSTATGTSRMILNHSSSNSSIRHPGVVGARLPVVTSSTSTAPPIPGYSILQSLPNVSIVPRFDRNSKPVVLPTDQEALERKLKKSSNEKAASSSTGKNNNSNNNNNNNNKKETKKEKHSKKKKGFVIPQPTSPLTVRKDSTNPVTYVGLTSKKSNKSNRNDSSNEAGKEPPTADPFNKLLQLKKSEPKGSSTTTTTTTTTSTTTNTATGTSSPQSKSPSPKEPKKSVEGSSHEDKSKTLVLDSRNNGVVHKTVESSQPPSQDTAPTFHPTEEQFQDPLKYIEQIRAEAEKFGIARIVPPRSFRPDCNVEDDMRFTAYNHYIHKMFQRWGPNVHETIAIKKMLRNSDVDISSLPLIGGMEIDLSTLYQTVQSLGGLKETIEKQKWNKVSDAMNIPKAANNRDSKLDSIYVKYVLPYETLSEKERKDLLDGIERNWENRQEKLKKKAEHAESESESDEDSLEEADDCIIKGKSTPLSSYYRVARNTRCMLFPNKEPTYEEVEEEYWKMVRKRTRHLCVYSGSIDCAGVGWGFPLPKASNKHPWNLKVLANSPGSVLRYMGPVMGATVPTLHVGMIFTTYCWYRDPHGLPWIEYLHSGGNKIWYVIPASQEEKFRTVVKKLLPLQCKNKKLWLASDSAMVPPELLREHGVSLYKAIQSPGEFLVVFPKAFTSAICTGYVVSESVCYAPNEWLDTAPQIFDDIRNSKEPPVFPLEKLLLSILMDHKVSKNILLRIYSSTEEILTKEFIFRKRLVDIGVRTDKLCIKPSTDKAAKKKRKLEDEVHQCDNCNYILHLSLVNNETHEFTYCLKHALEYLLKRKSHIKSSVLRFDYTQEDLTAMLTEVSRRVSEN